MTHPLQPTTLRGFWHGAPLGPYQLLCLRSFVDHGHRVELFIYDDDLNIPLWIERRDAREIIDTGHVLRYRSGFGNDSPSLHSNLLRYAMLYRLGGWWVDCDILLLSPSLPETEIFLAYQSEAEQLCGSSLIRLPAGHEMLQDAVDECLRVSEAATWGQTGPSLLTALAEKYGLVDLVHPSARVFPIKWSDISMLFDPDCADMATERCAQSLAVHLFNEVWRGAGIPSWLGPPAGSWLDRKFLRHAFGASFSERMRYPDLARWIRNRNEAIVNLERAATAEDTAARFASQLQAVHQSTSWRLTGPLRAFAKLIGR